MRFSTTLAVAAAPLALAKAVHNVYPGRRDSGLAPRKAKAQAQSSSEELAALQALGLSGVGLTENAITEVVVIWVNPGGTANTIPVNAQSTVTQTVTQTVNGGAGGATAASSAPPGAQSTHSVMVGGTAGLQYTPSSLNAAVGDMVVFTFMSQNHTVTQSAFATPCDALAGGMDSGFQANANNSVNPPPQVAMQVMVDTPLWFYCRQVGHCGKGMTFSINPTADKTQAMFQSMAIAQNGTGSGSTITGGTGANSTAGTGTAGGTGSAPPASSSSAAAAGGTGIQQGTGSVNADGSCTCAVTCAAGSFPAVQAQGIGAFGGMPGALPMNMAEAT